MVNITMLGKVNIVCQGENLNSKLSQKMVALICLLILNRNREMSKDKLAFYLWPDSDEEAARYNLRYNLWMIRKVIPQSEDGEPFLLAGKDYCQLNEKYPFNSDKIIMDRYQPHSGKRVDELVELKELFQGDFLEGLYLKNCNEFNELVLFERVVCQKKQVDILKELLDIHEVQGEYEEALQILHEMVSIEPYNEAFALRIIELYGKLGNRAAAIHYYKKLEATLRRDLNIAPNQELKILYNSVVDNTSGVSNERYDRPRARNSLNIQVRPFYGVDYFVVANVIRGILMDADPNYLLTLDKKYILDLSFIENELVLAYEKYISPEHDTIGQVPTVRIINAFYKFMSHVTQVYTINLEVLHRDEIDPMSLQMLKQLQESHLSHLNIHY